MDVCLKFRSSFTSLKRKKPFGVANFDLISYKYLNCIKVSFTIAHGFYLFQVIKLKERGNDCVREEKYEEAVFHYTHALKIDPLNYSIYSNRSLAFLKMQQYYFSLKDALQAIKIAPDWAKVSRLLVLLYCRVHSTRMLLVC